jgi:putative phage-type endonuclease
MCKVVIAKTNEISHEEWLKLRLKGVGGSDAAAVCGMSRYSSPLDVWLMKTRKKAAEPDNDKMYFGRLLEPIIREEFAKRTGFKVQECPFMFAYKEFPFMISNIDGVVTEPNGNKAVLEIKTTNSVSAIKDLEDGLPVEYFFQVQHYLAVTNLNKAFVAVLIGGNDFKIQAVERDDEVIQTIIALESKFWSDYVLKEVQPPADFNSSDALNQLYPKSNSKTVNLSADADYLVAQYQEIKTAEDELKKAKTECENKLKAMLGENESGITEIGYKVLWKSYSQSRLDSTKLKAEFPDIAEKFMTSTSGRKFSISEPKKSKK